MSVPEFSSLLSVLHYEEIADSIPAVRQLFFVENDHEIFSTVILSLPLIQEKQFIGLRIHLKPTKVC